MMSITVNTASTASKANTASTVNMTSTAATDTAAKERQDVLKTVIINLAIIYPTVPIYLLPVRKAMHRYLLRMKVQLQLYQTIQKPADRPYIVKPLRLKTVLSNLPAAISAGDIRVL